VARYEELRGHALAGARGPGLAPFLRGGMKAWLDGWRDCTPVRPPARSPAESSDGAVPAALQLELARVLAGMVLDAFQEVRA